MKQSSKIHTNLAIYISMIATFVLINLNQNYLDLHSSNIALVIILICSSFWFPKVLPKISSSNTLTLLAVFFILRILLSISTPLFEDDFYRYIVEGKMLNEGINPYRVSPLEFGMEYTMDIERKFSGDSTYHYINHSGFGTLSAIYPPIVISMFRAIDSPVSLAFLFIFSEALCLLFLGLYITKYSSNYMQNKALLLGWYIHPLVLYEGYLNRHYDLWIGLLILIALVFYNDHKNKAHSLFFALAIHLKGYSLIYLPFFKHSRWHIFGCWIVLEILSYLWYPARFLKKSSLNTFINQWEFNNGLFTHLRIYLETIFTFQEALLYARVVFLSIFILTFLFLYFKWSHRQTKNAIFIFVSVLFFTCSPVSNPWYFLMSVPFFLNYCSQYQQHYFLSLLSFYYLFYIGVDPLESLTMITGLTWLVLILSFYRKNNTDPKV